MKTGKIFAAFVAALITFLSAGFAGAAPLQAISSGGDFGVGSVVEVPGTYPPVVYLYGGSSRANLPYTQFGVLTSADGFATVPSWQPMNGIVGYGASQLNTAIVTCPSGQTCGGYKAFYVIDNPGRLYRCTGLSGVANLTGCALWSVPGVNFFASLGVGLDQTGDKLLVSAQKTGDTRDQIYSVDIASSLATKLTACSDPSNHTEPNGSVVGEGSNRYFYVYHNSAHHRFAWNGTTCTGPRLKVGAGMGWDNGVDDPANDDYYGAVGKTTGTFYFSRVEGDFFISQKDASCNDSFISGAEKCDPNSSSPLNGQSCTTIGGGFSSGTLACNAATCGWNTSGCVTPTDCGNGVINPGEECDGTALGGKSCASENGVGWSGILSCSGTCSVIKTACAPPPSCGDGACNGTENCTSCAGDCGACLPGVCGDGVVNSGEECDGSVMVSTTCDAVKKSVGWNGAVKCTACKLDATECKFGWGIKNLTGACTLGGEGAAQSVNFSGGNCSAEYWPIEAVKAIKVSWAASAGKAILLAVAAGNLRVNVPEGVSHQEIDDNGVWKYELEWDSGVSASAEGTKYSAVEKVFPIVAFGCKEGSIRLRMKDTPIAAINVDGSPGRIPAGYGAEVNVLTGAVTKGPYKLDSIPTGDGGVDVDGGILPPSDASVGNDAGTNPPGGGGGDGGGCSCSVPPAEGGFGAGFLAAFVGLTVLVRRRRN